MVSKDNGDTKTLLPIVQAARCFGYHVMVFAEGVGVAHYAKEGVATFFSDAPNPDPHSSFDFVSLFSCVRPHAVLVGFPFPNNLSHQASAAANLKGITLIGVEDNWGGVKRNSEYQYACVLTIDEYAKDLASPFVNPDNIVIIGNHAIPGAEYHPHSSVSEQMKALRMKFDSIFVYGGGGEYTTDELRLLVSSLERTPGNWCLIPRYHPNYKKKTAEEIGDSRSFEKVWDELLLPIQDRVVRVDEGNSDDMAMLCDAYFSGWGSSMSTAISCGKPTIAVSTEATQKALYEHCLDVVPAVYIGGAHLLQKTQDISPLLVAPPISVQKNLFPLNPGRAVDVINRL